MSSESVALLREYLHQQVALGHQHVLLRSTARNVLTGLGKGGTRESTTAKKADTPSNSSDKTARLQAIARAAEEAPAPRALGTLRTTMVFATGNPDADIMLIGEAPGAEEEKQGEPFVGPAGQLLNRIITAMGLKRESVYISNICKFRPAMENQRTGNRQPTAAEMESCLPFILSEIEIVQPKVIIALGATACAGLGIEGSVGKNRGRLHEKFQVPVVVTYHPSYLLRQEEEQDRGITAKRQSWEDFMLAMETVGLPINEKQRNYFKARL